METFEKELLKFISKRKEEEKTIKEEIVKRLSKISTVEDLLIPSKSIELPSLELTPFVNRKIYEWLWNFGLPPILVNSIKIESQETFEIFVPGEGRTIYQVITLKDGKFYCGCGRNAKALSWVSTKGICSHKVRVYYYLTNKYYPSFLAIEDEKERKSIEDKWFKKIEEFRKGRFGIKFIDENALAVQKTIESFDKSFWDNLIESIDKVWDKFTAFKTYFKYLK